MADSVTLSGSGELDNGMTVSLSFELEGGGDAVNSFDSQSVTIASEDLGTLVFAKKWWKFSRFSYRWYSCW